MSEMKPVKRKGSLLERADSRFDFGRQLRRLDPATLGDGPVLDARPAKRISAPRRPGANEPVSGDAAAVAGALSPPPQPVAAPASVATASGASSNQPAGANPVALANVRKGVARRRFESRAPMQPIDPSLLAELELSHGDSNVSVLAEEYRIIKRQLLHSAGGSPAGRRILITSAQPAEGKTYSAICLALSLAAEHDLSVLLVDGDSVHREVPKRLGIVPGLGLLDVLADSSVDLADCVIPTDIPELSVLPVGTSTSHDTELLNSARMLELFSILEAEAPDRIIIFDSLPLLAASSVSVLAHLCGQVVIVVRADVTREATLRDAIGLIGQHHGLSLLLNRVRFTPEGRRFGSYYGK